MDFSHFPFVHENILGTRDRAFIRRYDVTETDFGLVYVHEEPADEGTDPPAPARHEYIVHMPFTAHIRKVEANGNVTVKTLYSCPISAKQSRIFVQILRNHSLDRPDSEFGDFNRMIMEQDRVVVESQRPEEIPLDLREELHIKVPDAASLLYRTRLAELGVKELILP
jgi:phenylpropionate dioxygenase-like ring-hydroxylating dioxygenase large terminal subunit